MKRFALSIAILTLLSAAASPLRAQDLRGTVCDAEGQPLVGASVYWAGTTVGASTDAQGAFLVHRVRGYDRLVASYLGYVNDTLRVGDDRTGLRFALEAEGVSLDEVVLSLIHI